MPLLFCPGRETTIIQHPPENGLQGPSRRNKVFSYAATALADVPAGAVVLISGFAGIGWPEALLTALHSGGADRLTLVCQGVWPDHGGQRQGYSGVERLVTDSGALGYRAVEPPQGPSSSPAELVDSNGRRVVFAPGGGGVEFGGCGGDDSDRLRRHSGITTGKGGTIRRFHPLDYGIHSRGILAGFGYRLGIGFRPGDCYDAPYQP